MPPETRPLAAPAVTVLMTTYNGGALIGESIRSILSQTFTDYELVIVDDCSTDDTVERIRAFADPRIRLVCNPRNLDVVGSRNVGFATARGRYVATLDHDDLSEPERLARQVAYLDAHPGTVVVGTVYRYFGLGRNDLMDIHVTTPLSVRWMLHLRNPVAWSSMMARTDAVARLDGPLRPERVLADELDFYHRMLRQGDIARLPEPLTRYRVHASNTSGHRMREMQRNGALVLAEAYAPWFGPRAAEAADRVIRLVAGRENARDDADLFQLKRDLEQLAAGFLRDHAPPPELRAEIGTSVRTVWRQAVQARVKASGFRGLRFLRTILREPGMWHRDMAKSLLVALAPAVRRLRPR